MTTANEHLKSIQSRIDELEQTISSRGEQIKSRAVNLKDELQEELAPAEVVRRHPFKTTGAALLAGLLFGRAVRSVFSPGHRRSATIIHEPASNNGHGESYALKAALAAIGLEFLHAGKDMAISWLKTAVEEKKRKEG